MDAPTIAALASLLTAASVFLATWRAGRIAKVVKKDLLEAEQVSDAKLDELHRQGNGKLDALQNSLELALTELGRIREIRREEGKPEV